jgi:cytoskeleton protein RodZ
MNTIGETMRRERVRQGLDLQAVSENTKIGTRMLKAMEAGDFGKLPGGVFTRSFVRQYATALGLDPAYVEAELTELNLQPEEKNSSSERNVEPSRRTLFADAVPEAKSIGSSLIWVAVAVLVCGGIFFLLERSRTGTPVSAQVEEKAAPPVTQQAKKPEPPPTAATPSVAPPAQSGTGLLVVVSASAKAWVSVSADGKPQFAAIMQPGEKREVHAEETVKLTTGNAGGIEVQLNGKPTESLGTRGQVRTVDLTRSGIQVVSRTPKPGPSL